VTWNMNDKEYEAVLSLPAERRYRYFVKKVAGEQVVWSLTAGNGWASGLDPAGQEVFPVWPHPRFAAACATGSWEGDEPRSIDLSAWLERWTSGLYADGTLVAVFPTPSGKGVVVGAARLREDIEEECSLYE
jgi:hypothetical protein